MSRAPAFQFYPDKWQSHTRRLSDQSYRVYHELLCWMWQSSEDYCSVQNSPEAIACAIAMQTECVRIALAEIQNPFSPLLKEENGRLVSNGLKKARQAQLDKSHKAKEAANARWKDANAMQTHKPSNAQNANPQCTPSPTPSPTPKTINRKAFVPPTIEEIKARCLEIGLPEIEAEKFEAHHEARGWRYRQGPMKSWKGALKTWKQNWDSGAFSFQGAKSPQPVKGGGQATWKKIQDLENEIKQLEGQLVQHFDRERYPHKVERLNAAKVELEKLKSLP